MTTYIAVDDLPPERTFLLPNTISEEVLNNLGSICSYWLLAFFKPPPGSDVAYVYRCYPENAKGQASYHLCHECNGESVLSVITKEEFDIVLSRMPDSRLEKRRFTVSNPEEDGLTFMFDMYSGRLEGIQILRCDFITKQAAKEFKLPYWDIFAGAIELIKLGNFEESKLSGMQVTRDRLFQTIE